PCAPARAAATAAACPAGPPPTTSTSVSTTTGVCPPGSVTISIAVPPCDSRNLSLPPNEQPFHHAHQEEEGERDGRCYHHGRVEQSRTEIIRREDDQVAQSL